MLLNTIKWQNISHQCIQLKRKNNKRLSKKPDPHQFSMSQTRVVPNPPLRKSLNIYIFNPIKNVTKRNKQKQKTWVTFVTQLNIRAHLFCAAVTCIAPKSSSSSRLRLRLPVTEKNKKNNLMRKLHRHQAKLLLSQSGNVKHSGG